MAGELTPDERDARDQQHLHNPEAGDTWREMGAPVCVVLGRTKDSVTLCKRTREADPEHWTWDLAHVETMALEAFAAWLRYKGEHMGGKTWCRVSPRAHLWAREAVFGEPSITTQPEEPSQP